MSTTDAPDVLEAIVAATRRIVEGRARTLPLADLEARAQTRPARPGVFRAALTQPAAPRVVAECKRRSPSRGVLCQDYNPARIAAAYERNGAAAISVLTEPTFFDGAPSHLEAVRSAVSVPVLRKDFIVGGYQLAEARAWGADAVLLIVAALTDPELASLLAQAARWQLETLVEAHDAREIDRAVDAGATIVGVNHRDLRTLEVSTHTSEKLVARLPRGVVAVAESGLRTPADLARLTAAGFHAFLVGERLMTTPDPGAALKELRTCPRV
jgi:indole-3-glycerol phosphate synthase